MKTNNLKLQTNQSRDCGKKMNLELTKCQSITNDLFRSKILFGGRYDV